MMKLIICIALLSYCVAAPTSNTQDTALPNDLENENELEFNERTEEDLDPATRNIITGLFKQPTISAAVLPSGQTVYIVQRRRPPFIYRFPWNRKKITTTTEEPTTTAEPTTTEPTTTAETTTPTTTTAAPTTTTAAPTTTTAAPTTTPAAPTTTTAAPTTTTAAPTTTTTTTAAPTTTTTTTTTSTTTTTGPPM